MNQEPPSQDTQEPVANLTDFTSSELFARTFREGMDLVEETAAYLDGPGREEAKRLDRVAALAYVGESMRLTTRLMQVASWLLVQRALREGEMNHQEASQPKYRLNGDSLTMARRAGPDDELPMRLLDLITRSERLYDRVARLDRKLFSPAAPDEEAENVVATQLDRVRVAFARGMGE